MSDICKSCERSADRRPNRQEEPEMRGTVRRRRLTFPIAAMLSVLSLFLGVGTAFARADGTYYVGTAANPWVTANPPSHVNKYYVGAVQWGNTYVLKTSGGVQTTAVYPNGNSAKLTNLGPNYLMFSEIRYFSQYGEISFAYAPGTRPVVGPNGTWVIHFNNLNNADVLYSSNGGNPTALQTVDVSGHVGFGPLPVSYKPYLQIVYTTEATPTDYWEVNHYDY
jgi:hypothetical protein